MRRLGLLLMLFGMCSEPAFAQAEGTVSGSNSGDVTLGAVDTNPNNNAAILTGQKLQLELADGTHPGLLSATTQTIGGAKTFSASILPSADNTLNLGSTSFRWAGIYLISIIDSAGNNRFNEGTGGATTISGNNTGESVRFSNKGGSVSTGNITAWYKDDSATLVDAVIGDGTFHMVGVATGSLQACAAGTTGVQYDSTRNCLVVCNASAWSCVGTSSDWNFGAPTNQTTGTGLIAQTTTVNAGTYRSSNFATDITGVGGGNFVLKLCSDGATCAAGNTFATCTVSCTATGDTQTACTAGSKTTYTAGTVISLSISTACATTNQIGGFNAQFTNP